MNIDNSLISTALLALQAAGELQFGIRILKGKSGFFKSVESICHDDRAKHTTFVYMDKKSPTGYAIRVEADYAQPGLLLLDRHIDSFEDFEESIEGEYYIAAHKATRRRQLGK